MAFGPPLFYKCIFITEKDWTERSYDGDTRATNQLSSFQVERENHLSCVPPFMHVVKCYWDLCVCFGHVIMCQEKR